MSIAGRARKCHGRLLQGVGAYPHPMPLLPPRLGSAKYFHSGLLALATALFHSHLDPLRAPLPDLVSHWRLGVSNLAGAVDKWGYLGITLRGTSAPSGASIGCYGWSTAATDTVRVLRRHFEWGAHRSRWVGGGRVLLPRASHSCASRPEIHNVGAGSALSRGIIEGGPSTRS